MEDDLEFIETGLVDMTYHFSRP